jgi:microsomal dipeptidase-like Zn-dependent dipeptidase
MRIDKTPKTRNRAPATTPEDSEQQMVSLAVQLAEKQMVEGTASAQVISHYLKLGSTREKLEQERLARENALLQAKVEQLASAKKVEELYEQALNAMRTYAGQEPIDQDYDED